MRLASRGVALIQVMLIFVMLSVLVIEIGSRQSRSILNTQNWLERGQLQAWRDSVEALARAELQRDFNESFHDGVWNTWLEPFALEPGLLWLRLTPLDDRFNLNWVQSRPWGFSALKSLLHEQDESTGWADLIFQWLHPESGLSQQLLMLNPPYASAYDVFVDWSELDLLKPMLYGAHERPNQDWMSILPAQSALHIGRASDELLMAINAGIGTPQLQRLEALRDQPHKVQAWLASAEMAAIRDELQPDWFTDTDGYFRVESWLNFDSQNLYLTLLLYRDDVGNIVLKGRHFLPIADLPVDTERQHNQNEPRFIVRTP